YKPPVANAGADKIAMVGDSVVFDAGLSSDSDGNITSYQWEENGTILSSSVTFSTTNLTQGTHHIFLTVVDDSNASSQDEVVVTISERQRTNKKSADGYIIKLPSPASALCSNGQSYQSSLTVGAKGEILFDRVELTDDCIITVPSGTTIDSNNNAQLDVSDKVINFEMKAPADAKFISPLTTLLLEKEARGEDVTEFKAMVKDFDPVEGASDILSKTGVEKIKVQKLLVMMEVLKTTMKNSSSIVDINISSIINTENNETIDTFDINKLVSTLPSNIKNIAKTKADTIKRLTKVIKDINSSKISIDSFIVNVSDGGQNISTSLKNSIKPNVEVNQSNIIEDVSKPEAVSELNNLNQISNNIPIAVAGADQNVREQTTVTLDASQSSDIDNDIVSYEWKDNNTSLSNQRVFNENNFSIGTHNITLTVTDEFNASSYDSVTITINPNQLPTVDAGNDFAMQINDTITLSASATDSDGNIVSYEWEKGNTVVSNSRTFSYTPTAVGNDILEVTV
ncbi:MAG: PKD domain-containing protein, partial [Sulfurovaceae bacterium]|nr:PKD domain-containing protein [Sulfurovaceae bacterium]